MSALVGQIGCENDHLPQMARTLGHRGEVQARSAEVALLGHGTTGTHLHESGDLVLALSGQLFGRTPAALAEEVRSSGSIPTDLRGTFVLACWEPRTRRLTLVRDGAGRRTLYHARFQGGIVFGSEPKGIHQLGGFDRQLRPAAVAQYLAFSFVPGSGTMLEGIEEIPAGSSVTWEADTGRLTLERWFRPEQLACEKDEADPRDWAEEFRETHRRAVSRLLPDSGEQALFLSGGIDSSVVAAELDPARTTAFSLHFGRGLPNELPYATAGRGSVWA